MTVQVDDAVKWAFAQIVEGLRSVRVASDRSQNALSANLPVRGRAISEWETGRSRSACEAPAIQR